MADYITYANQGAVRNQPISPDLAAAFGFLPEMGLGMQVFSGGQAAKGSGQPRVGSVRHDHGQSADVFFTRDGQRLDWANPEQTPIFQDIVSRAKQAGVTGFGAGQGYMQPGSMHVGYGAPAVWGAGGKGANAPEWLRTAYGAISPGQPSPQQAQFSTQGAAPMARAQQPAGLLPMPQAPEQAGILGGILGDKVNSYLTPDRLARLQMGLEGMTLNPNQALMASAREGIQGRAKAREEARGEGARVGQVNKTIEWLNSQGMGDLANAVASGVLPIGQAFNAAQQAMSTPGVETTTLNGRLINKQTGEVIADFSTPDDDVQGAVRSLMQRAELGGLEPGTPEYEAFMIQGGANKGMSFQVSPDGTVSLATGGADIKPLTEGQSASATYATRAEGALPTLDEYDTALTSRLDRVKDADPTGFARGTQNKEYQLARQAGDEFLQAILRKDTGAAITEGEQALYGVTYLPQPGDGDELIAQKRQARKRALEAMKAGMSPAAMVAQEAALGRVETPAASDWSGPSAQQVMQMTPEQATQYLSGVNVADLPEDVQDAILKVLE